MDFNIKKLITLALIIGVTTLTQAQSNLVFNRVLNFTVTSQVQATVPEGKVWKVVNMFFADDPLWVSLKINSGSRYIHYGFNPFWLPQGTTIKNNGNFDVELNIIEFNTD
jgi:hypothetical protein